MYTKYLTPKSNTIYARYSFHEKIQRDKECFDHFIKEPKLIVKDCSYSEEMVMDQIVLATTHSAYREAAQLRSTPKVRQGY